MEFTRLLLFNPQGGWTTVQGVDGEGNAWDKCLGICRGEILSYHTLSPEVISICFLLHKFICYWWKVWRLMIYSQHKLQDAKKKIIIIKIWEMASFTFLTLKKSFSKLSPAIQPQKCVKCHKISPPSKKNGQNMSENCIFALVWEISPLTCTCMGDHEIRSVSGRVRLGIDATLILLFVFMFEVLAN